MSKSASSGSVSVAQESSSDALVCGNSSKGGAFNKLHYVATLFYSWVIISVCVSINNPCTICYICLQVCIQYNFTFVPAFLPFIHTDTCTDFILMVGTCIAASDVLGMDN